MECDEQIDARTTERGETCFFKYGSTARVLFSRISRGGTLWSLIARLAFDKWEVGQESPDL